MGASFVPSSSSSAFPYAHYAVYASAFLAMSANNLLGGSGEDEMDGEDEVNEAMEMDVMGTSAEPEARPAFTLDMAELLRRISDYQLPVSVRIQALHMLRYMHVEDYENILKTHRRNIVTECLARMSNAELSIQERFQACLDLQNINIAAVIKELPEGFRNFLKEAEASIIAILKEQLTNTNANVVHAALQMLMQIPGQRFDTYPAIIQTGDDTLIQFAQGYISKCIQQLAACYLVDGRNVIYLTPTPPPKYEVDGNHFEIIAIVTAFMQGSEQAHSLLEIIRLRIHREHTMGADLLHLAHVTKHQRIIKLLNIALLLQGIPGDAINAEMINNELARILGSMLL